MQYVLYAAGTTPVPDLVAPVMGQVDAVKRALAPWAAGQMYLNFAETQRPGAPFWTAPAYRRLRQIKANVDPADMIRSNHPVPPGR
jgi:Berberine and berberine like